MPNFSEGRRSEVVEEIVDAARSVPDVQILDVHSDVDHNRSVVTLAGEAGPVQEAVYQAVRTATRLIDLREHSGEHPRVGATDVVPFVPLGSSTMAEAVAVAHAVGQRIADELEIPVYLYEEAAARPERRNLEAVRRKGFEELREAITTQDDRAPDLGPRRVHSSAGAVIVGARGPLIAFNMYLNTTDVSIARTIAKTIRHSSGGLRFVKALGLDIPARNQVQISMNLTNYHKTSVYTVFNLVKCEAESYGLTITESEIVGLVPLDALLDTAQRSLRVREFDHGQILELKLLAE